MWFLYVNLGLAYLQSVKIEIQQNMIITSHILYIIQYQYKKQPLNKLDILN